MEKIDRISEIALWVAVLAITMSSAAITWSISRTKTIEYEMAQLHEEVDVLDMRVQRLQATLEAQGRQP